MLDVISKLRRRHEALRKTLAELADEVRVHKGTMSRYETGGIEPPLSKLVAWGEALGVIVDVSFRVSGSERQLRLDDATLTPAQRRLIDAVLDVAPALDEEHADTLARTIRILGKP